MTQKAISLFTGIGGLDFGFEAAGFRTAVAVDSDRICIETIKLNCNKKRKWKTICDAVENVSSEKILKTARLEKKEAAVLIAGPPCQPFSKSGYWASGDTQRLHDPRANTLESFLRVLRDTLPQTFLLENVPGLAYREKNEGLEYLLKQIEHINEEEDTSYRPVAAKLNAASYGVPQNRERVFVVASRDGRDFQFPRPTHGPRGTRNLEPYHTAWDAIGRLAGKENDGSLAMGGKWAELLPSIPEGQNYLWHTSRGGGEPLFGWRTRYWSFLLKLTKDKPAWTIQAQPGPSTGPFHWKNRRLSAVEMCRLQTFPKGLRFDCSNRDVQRMVGNAVPSLLAEVLAWEIRKQLLGTRSRSARYKLMPRRSKRTPPPELCRKVPRKYLQLRGDHKEHPGTGQGPLWDRKRRPDPRKEAASL